MPISRPALALVAAAAAGWSATAGAQSVADDVRCLSVASALGPIVKEEAQRRAVAMTASFYLGRVSTRLSDPAVAAAIRAQGAKIPVAQVDALMKACAARAGAAQQAMAAIANKARQK